SGVVDVGDVRGALGHRYSMSLSILYKSETAVERYIEPLVSISGPRICTIDTFDQMTSLIACRGPESERSVDMHPGSMFRGDRNYLFKVIVSSNVYISGLQQDDGRRVGISNDLVLQ